MSETKPCGSLFEEFSAVDIDAWKQAVEQDLGISDPDDFLEWSSLEGVSLPAYLQRDALQECSHVASDAPIPPLAGAEERPANTWTTCQTVAHPDPHTANEHARTALDSGVSDLRLTYFPQASQTSSIILTAPEDLATVLNGVDVSMTGLHLDRGMAAPVLYATLREYVSDSEINPDHLQGSVIYDPVSALASGEATTAEQAFSLAHDLLTDGSAFPEVRTLSVDSRAYHDAGASTVDELALTLGALSERLARGTEQDTALSTLLDNLQFVVAVSTSYFVEIAKLRALRLLVPQVVAPFLSATDANHSFGPSDVHLQAAPSRRVETRYDPYANMLRTTTEAMAATLGGCDTFSVRPYDASLRPPDDFGLRIARNTPLILQHEAHVDQVADPAAGAYYVETLTDELAQKAWSRFQDLEAKGGIVEGLREGAVHRRISDTRDERLDAIDERDHVLVGTTHYPALDERRRDDLAAPETSPSTDAPPQFSLDEASIDALRRALRDGTPPSGIYAALQTEGPAVEPLPRIRVAADTESIRLRTERYADAHDGPPHVLLVPIGPSSARSARATFARNLLGVAGFEVDEPLKFETVPDAADAATDRDADVVVLCSSDDQYPDLAPSLASALDERAHDALLVVAGSPDDLDVGEAADLFVHQGGSLHDTLETIQQRLGIPVTTDA